MINSLETLLINVSYSKADLVETEGFDVLEAGGAEHELGVHRDVAVARHLGRPRDT